jgi:hypothetical protein
MELTFHEEPFKHITVKNVLSSDELDLIWQEVRFLSSPEKLNRPGIDHGAGGLGGYTNSRAAILEAIYARPQVSDIISIITDVTRTLGKNAADKWKCFTRARNLSEISTKLRYYHDGDEYQTHTDSSQEYLMFFYLHKEPKSFEGGELYFEEYDYEFKALNNTAIFMPSYVDHAVKRVKIAENDYWSGRGRYAITQFALGQPKSKIL